MLRGTNCAPNYRTSCRVFLLLPPSPSSLGAPPPPPFPSRIIFCKYRGLCYSLTVTDQILRPRKTKGKSIYCKSKIRFRRHNNIMVYLLSFNITYIIILATCFDSYESSSGLNSRTTVHIVLQFFVLQFLS